MWKTLCNILIFVGLLIICADTLYYQYKSSNAELRKNHRISQIIAACEVYINDIKIEDKIKVDISREAMKRILQETNYDGSYKYQIGKSLSDLKE